MNGLALREIRTRMGLTQSELGKLLQMRPDIISVLERGGYITDYDMVKIDRFFLGEPVKISAPVVKRDKLNQPRSPVYNLIYPKEMKLQPLSEEACEKIMLEEMGFLYWEPNAKLHIEESEKPNELTIAAHAQYVALKKRTPKDTRFSYSEITPSVGDILFL